MLIPPPPPPPLPITPPPLVGSKGQQHITEATKKIQSPAISSSCEVASPKSSTLSSGIMIYFHKYSSSYNFWLPSLGKQEQHLLPRPRLIEPPRPVSFIQAAAESTTATPPPPPAQLMLPTLISERSSPSSMAMEKATPSPTKDLQQRLRQIFGRSPTPTAAALMSSAEKKRRDIFFVYLEHAITANQVGHKFVSSL